MIHEKHLGWLAARGIEPGLIELFGLDTRQSAGAAWLTLPYVENGAVVNHKWRRTNAGPEDLAYMMDKGAPLLLFNADDIKSAAKGQLIITEGEWDTLALKTASFETPCVSVPNGAAGEETENPWEAKRYEWYQRHQADLDRVKTFILATDNDSPGRSLAGDLAVLLGPERCRFVTYPEGCKDLNDVLLKHGGDAVMEVIDTAKPYPIKGLYRFSDYPPKADHISLHSRLEGVKGNWPLVMGTMSVITGWSGIGKTSLLAWIMADYIQQGVAMAVGSFETDPEILRKVLKAALLRAAFSDRQVHEPHADIDQLIEDHVLLISQHCGNEEAEMTIEYLLDCARVAAVRDGAKLIIIDPWNELEHKRRRDETETDYIGRAIRAIKRFARRYNVAVWVVAHPTKPDWNNPERAPTLYSISGSSHWNNKADYGVIIHRKDKKTAVTELIIDKVRMGLPGQEITVTLAYNKWTTSYMLEG